MDLTALCARSLKREGACVCVCVCVCVHAHCKNCDRQEEAKDKGCGHWCVNPGFTIDRCVTLGKIFVFSVPVFSATKWA